MTTDLRIAYLADRPDLIPELARWFHREWGYLSADRTAAHYERLLRQNLNKGRVPLTLIAFSDGHPVGTVSLDRHDMPSRPELTPWLASLVVAPDRRRQGIGTRLIRRLIDEARQLAVPKLYLFTVHHAALYAREGWVEREKTAYCGEPVVIMEREI